MASFGWSEEKLSQLNNEETRLITLKEIKEHLETISRTELSTTTNSIQLPLIFDCLNDSNKEQIDVACDVLSICMENLNLGETTNKYSVFLERALNHPNTNVKLMVLKEIERNVNNDDILIDLCKKQSLIQQTIKCIADQDLEVANKTTDILVIIGLSTIGIKCLTNPDGLKIIHETMAINEITRLRLYEVFIRISCQSEANFTILKSTGLLTQIVTELENNDILLRLNILELLTRLAESKHGYEFLETSEIMTLLSMILDDNDLVQVKLCEPGILKFFGCITHYKPLKIISKYPSIIKRLFDNFENSDFTVVGISLDTFGFIGLTNEGKVALDALNPRTDNMIKFISKQLPSYPSEIKVRALNCLENLLNLNEFNQQCCEITRKWYNLIDDNPIEFIWRYAKNPFIEFRLPAFAILLAIAKQSWGQEIIKNTPGLIEFLLDRNTEHTKECKEIKYEIIKVLANCAIFDDLILKRLQHYVKEGPFYVQAVTQVAIERNE